MLKFFAKYLSSKLLVLVIMMMLVEKILAFHLCKKLKFAV